MRAVRSGLIAAAVLAALSLPAVAQNLIKAYPAAAVAFLDAELPRMEAAVAAKDRTYFAGVPARMTRFLETWGLKSNPAALEAWPMCTDAVTDFGIVGLCRIMPPGTICEPATFIPKFEKNLAQCRAAAGAPARPASAP